MLTRYLKECPRTSTTGGKAGRPKEPDEKRKMVIKNAGVKTSTTGKKIRKKGQGALRKEQKRRSWDVRTEDWERKKRVNGLV